jgi:hypothetical protein
MSLHRERPATYRGPNRSALDAFYSRGNHLLHRTEAVTVSFGQIRDFGRSVSDFPTVISGCSRHIWDFGFRKRFGTFEVSTAKACHRWSLLGDGMNGGNLPKQERFNSSSISSSRSRYKDFAREGRGTDMFPGLRQELYHNLAIDGRHVIVSDLFPEQPSARGFHRTEDSVIKWLQLVSGSGSITIG